MPVLNWIGNFAFTDVKIHLQIVYKWLFKKQTKGTFDLHLQEL